MKRSIFLMGLGGLGYLFPKIAYGMTINAKYYYGLIDVNISQDGRQNNSAIYFTAAIPIGKKKAEKAQKNAANEQTKE